VNSHPWPRRNQVEMILHIPHQLLHPSCGIQQGWSPLPFCPLQFSSIYNFSINIYSFLPWPFCNGALHHCCSVLRTSLGVPCCVLPFQFNKLFQFDIFHEDGHSIKILNIFHFETFVYAGWSKRFVEFVHWA